MVIFFKVFSIGNKELYIANQETVDTDYIEFKKSVMSYVTE